MSKNHKDDNKCTHSAGCGCAPPLFVSMMENAGLKLSRRDFIKSTTAVGGMVALGGLAFPMLASGKAAKIDSPADAIYLGGPILTMVKDGDRAEALARRALLFGTEPEALETLGRIELARLDEADAKRP